MTLRRHLHRRQPSRSAILLLVAGLLALAAAPALATSWVRVADHHLVEQAPLIVEAKVAGAGHNFADGKPYLDYEAEVTRVVKGAVEEDTLVIRSLGGPRPDGTFLRIWGTPELRGGERMLLFLKPWDDGTHRVLHLFQGAFHVVRFDGRDVAYRNLGAGELEMKRARPPAPESPRDLDAFVQWVAALDAMGPETALPSADYRLDLPVDELRAATEARTQKYTLLALPDGRGFRWREFETGGRVPFRAHQAGQSGLAGGGFQQVRSAISAWNADGGSNIRYRYAGTTSADGGFTDRDFVNTILFDDFGGAGEFDEPFSCTQGGVLAKGGPLAIREAVHMVNGSPFLTSVEADIVTNKGAECFYATASSSEEVFAHELGHTLGFGHSCGDDSSPSCGGAPVLNDALMRAQAHGDGRGARLNSDDRAVANFVYGEVQAPPAAPGGLAASANADFSVSLAWNDNSDNETGFAVDRRMVGGLFDEVATVGRGVRSYVDATAPSGSNLEYRVRAFNGAGQSDPSNLASVTTLGESPPSPLVATATGPSTVLLEWEDNSEIETGFEIEARDLGGFGKVAEVGPDVTEVTLEDLLVETDVSFRVRSLGEPGESTFSDPVTVTTLPWEPSAECEEDEFGTCLNRERFRVISRVRDSKGAFMASRISPVDSGDSGIFYFFGEENWEILVKVLDGCPVNDHYWVFAAGTTTVEYELRVTDTRDDVTVVYTNELGEAAEAVTDVEAFAGCD